MAFDKNGGYKKDPSKETKFVYEGEGEDEKTVENDESRRVNLIEVPKKRPAWFDNNLKAKISSTKLSDN